MTIDPMWLAGQAVVLLGAGVVAYIKLTERVTRLESVPHEDLSDRVIRLETLLDVLGKKAAKLLHSPSDHHDIDVLLDKYLDRHYELTPQEWRLLLDKCLEIENNSELPKNDRLLASWISAVAHHKLKLDPPERKK